MPTPDFFTLVATAAVSGAVVASIINWLRSELSDRAALAASYVLDQLRYLYGPLSFYATQNENIVSVHSALEAAYDEEYIQPNFSDDATTQENIKKQADSTIALQNSYSARWTDNNNAMVSIIRENYGLIDPEDANLFQAFAVHTLRSDLETGDTAPPFCVRLHLGSPNVYRSDFVDAIKARFAAKKGELDSLRKPPWWKSWAKRPTAHSQVQWDIITRHDLLKQHRATRQSNKAKQEEIQRNRERS